jgi:hypothetical protein
MSRIILLVVAAGLISACASRPQHIEARPVGPLTYINYQCKEISQEVYDTVTEIQALADTADQMADENHLRNFFWWGWFPVTMVEEYDNGINDPVVRLEYLKGNYLSAQQAAQFNQCDNVKIQPLSAFISNKYYLSEDDRQPYKKVKITSSSASILKSYDASVKDKKSRFITAINKLDQYLKHKEINRQEYRYVVSLLIEKHLGT